ncbi:MAG: hypothetical protein M3186_07580 [Actinomycetota bacterium]|nr:hypothetical protein [Actinomycetota bacterium]
MTSRTPRRHRRLAFMAAGMAAALVLLPGAASAQVVHSVPQITGTSAEPVPPGDPVAPNPNAPTLPELPVPLPGGTTVPTPDGLNAPDLRGSDDKDRHRHDDRYGGERRDDTEDSDHLDDPEPPDHASGAVARVDLLKEHLLDITRYDATIEDDDSAHAESTVLGLGGDQIVGSDASSKDGDDREGDDGDLLSLCEGTGGLLCLSLLYHDTVAKEDRDSALAAARGGVLALCVGGDDDDVTATYECDGLLSLGVAEGLGIAERDKKFGHTKADSANELLNLCIGQREKLTEACDGVGLQAVHADSRSISKKPDTERHSYLLGLDLGGESTYLVDGPEALTLPDDCGDSAILCLFLNQGKSVIFENPKYKGAGSVQEMLRLDVLNETLLVVLGQAESLAHETDRDKDKEHGKKDEEHGDKGDEGGKDEAKGPELAETGADVAALLAGGFLLTGMGALTVAAVTRRRVGKHAL